MFDREGEWTVWRRGLTAALAIAAMVWGASGHAGEVGDGSRPSSGLDAGPAALASLTAGQTVGGHFSVRSVYEGADGQPRGGRFIHRSGMPVDVLFFPAVAQLSLCARTLPTSDKGEPHTGEHLLLGKGRSGHRFGALTDMRMSVDSAETHDDMVCYHLRTAADTQGFFELLDGMFSAVLRPDYTDEEIRREVAHVAPKLGPDGRLQLEEKGTVYAEVSAAAEQAGWAGWRQIKEMVYGPGHPLAFEAGGTPEGIRSLGPDEVRAFHAAHYQVGPNLSLVVALPLGSDLDGFLAHLDRTLRQSSGPNPNAVVAVPQAMPPARPARAGTIRIGKFPAKDLELPQSIFLAWPAMPDLTLDQSFRIQLLLEVLAGGDTSLLHHDLVDEKLRRLRTGATGIGYQPGEGPLPFVRLFVTGVPVSSINEPLMRQLSAVIRRRIAWLTNLPPGKERDAITRQARGIVQNLRRTMLAALDDSPAFGDRALGGDAWHRHLLQLDKTAGFRKPLQPESVFRSILADLDGAANPWHAIVRECHLDGAPVISAVRPDAQLVARTRAGHQRRLKEQLERMKARFASKDPQVALQKLKAEMDAATRALDARDADDRGVAFLAAPPLTLDEAPFARSTVAGVPLVRTHFPTTVFTSIQLAFDLRHVGPADLPLLPLLIEAVGEVGVTTAAGGVLDHAATADRVRESIAGIDVSLASNPARGRAELSWTARASSRDEIDVALGWLESFLLRPRLDPSTRQRLIELLRREIQGLRNTLADDSEGWVDDLATELVYQDQPLVAVNTPFSRLYLFERLRWQLAGAAPAARAGITRTLKLVEAAVATGHRDLVSKRLAASHDEVGEQLRFALGHLPPESWQGDLRRLTGEIARDIGQDPAAVIDRLRRLLIGIVARQGARAQITGNEANADRAAAGLGALLARLPAGTRASSTPGGARPVEARLRERYPQLGKVVVHLGLVNDSAPSAALAVSAPGPDYRDSGPDAPLDLLAIQLFGGAGPASFFSQTWGAGLAYGNGIGVWPSIARSLYSADHCNDPVETMRFVAGLAKRTVIEPWMIQAALAQGFGDYRGTDSFMDRGGDIAADLADGLTPEVVRDFKTRLLRAAQSPSILTDVRARLAKVLGPLLVGVGGGVANPPGRLALVAGPQALLDKYERFLKDSGETATLPRLFPRDFWPAAEANPAE